MKTTNVKLGSNIKSDIGQELRRSVVGALDGSLGELCASIDESLCVCFEVEDYPTNCIILVRDVHTDREWLSFPLRRVVDEWVSHSSSDDCKDITIGLAEQMEKQAKRLRKAASRMKPPEPLE
jgi:hypothetical protein